MDNFYTIIYIIFFLKIQLKKITFIISDVRLSKILDKEVRERKPAERFHRQVVPENQPEGRINGRNKITSALHIGCVPLSRCAWARRSGSTCAGYPTLRRSFQEGS